MEVSAIIVTYNRVELLKKCISAVLSQSVNVHCLYIVDNASTDETKHFVNEIALKNDIIKYIRLETNTGGAGGFYYGLKNAFEDSSNDAFWVMDDDGVPDTYCLENLLKYIHEYAFISPLVLSIDDNSEMAFGTLHHYKISDIKEKYPSGVIQNHANPFNGVLFRRDLIEKIGYPMKEMFIWGDENEYEARIIANGYKYLTIIDAIHYHPKDRLVLYPDFLGKKCIVYVESKLKRYCKYRNFTYVLHKYKHWYNIVFYLLRYTYFYIISRKGDVKGLMFFYKAAQDGFMGNFNNHKKYIQC